MFQCFRRPTIQVMYWLVEIGNIAIKNWGEDWGREVLNEVLYREAVPQGPTPYPFIYHF